jgi:hypothetical protein
MIGYDRNQHSGARTPIKQRSTNLMSWHNNLPPRSGMPQTEAYYSTA